MPFSGYYHVFTYFRDINEVHAREKTCAAKRKLLETFAAWEESTPLHRRKFLRHRRKLLETLAAWEELLNARKP